MKAVKARKDAVVAPSRDGVEQSLKTLEGCTVYEGHGRFVAEKKVAVNASEFQAQGCPGSPNQRPCASPL
jgi:pyruvate/2-oxoglutarate dehydrogenase complex dihydrolipoamide dehydrogenase (E3) component